VGEAAAEPVGEGGGAVAGVEDEQRRGVPAVADGAQAAQHVLHLRDRRGCPGRGRGARRVDEAAHAVRRCPMAAVNWYSQPGTVLDDPLQWQAPLCTCSRPGEHRASGLG
jgi:hypothetical protein